MKRLLRGTAVRGLAAWLLGAYLRFALATTRWTLEGEANVAPFIAGAPGVVVCWHERLALVPALWLGLRRRPELRGRAVYMLVSRHRDGQLIGSILRRFGLHPILGSTTAGGVGGMKASLRRLADGAIIVLVPDGPQGPPRIPAAGAAALAGLAGVRVLPCAAQTSRRWIIPRSWDRMVLPLPFGRGTLVCGTPIAVPRTDWRAALPGIAAALDDATARADMSRGDTRGASDPS